MARLADGLMRAREMCQQVAAFLRAKRISDMERRPTWEVQAATCDSLATMFQADASVEDTSPGHYMVCTKCGAVNPKK